MDDFEVKILIRMTITEVGEIVKPLKLNEVKLYKLLRFLWYQSFHDRRYCSSPKKPYASRREKSKFSKAEAIKLSESPVPVLKQELLCLNASHLLQLIFLNKGSHLRSIRHRSLDLLEHMFLLLLLNQPYEARSTIIAEFLNVFQRKQTLWKAELFEQFNRLTLANFIAVEDLSALPVAFNFLRSH
ncbi:hypothetical protein IEQ34_021183 [Dendrobium chrysotoxum]|uniref:Maturase K n=1 Tax=Dendrobium chrysotoxum TaxID=161865 RepID=A0AAV7G2E4_DENCH|nr:hypothetical protein IEQ34_021183 [Dendrobium chrysotoxum]